MEEKGNQVKHEVRVLKSGDSSFKVGDVIDLVKYLKVTIPMQQKGSKLPFAEFL